MKKRRRVSNSKASPSRSPEPPPPVPKESSGPHPQTQLRPLPQPQPRPEEPLMSPGKRRRLQILALVLVVALGLWVRLEDLVSWKKEPGRAFYQGEPLLTALDGLFYLTLARDLVEGTYHPLDEKRAVPDYPPRPQPPPLISVLTAGVTRLLPLSINWVAVLLPAVLGVLIVLPLYGLGKFFGGPLAGTVAALIGLLPPYYVYRSGLGWLDTDCLNVTLAVGAACFFLQFGLTTGRRRYVHFAMGMLTYGLFLWWWDQTPHVVTAICLIPLAVALVFYYRPAPRERWIFLGGLGLGLLLLLLWEGMGPIWRFLGMLQAQFSYISKEVTGPFPNIGVSISEQVRPSFESMVTITSGNFLTFVTALCGLILLVGRHWKESLFLGALFGLSVFAFLFARRFAIFCVPLVALGTGLLVSELWALRRRFKLLTYAVPCFVAILIWPMLELNHTQTYWPKEPPPIVTILAHAEQKTPPEAVIWSWWDHGYTIPYWARRASVNDGSVHSGERTVYNAIPLATDNERLAANFMQFYVVRGMSGMHQFFAATGEDQAKGLAFIQRILADGPEAARAILEETPLPPMADRTTTEAWLEFFFPAEPRPVYLLLDDLLARTAYWWFWFGTWNMDEQDGTHTDYKVVPNIYEENGVLKVKGGGIEIDSRSGRFLRGNQVIPLEEITIWDGLKLQRKRFDQGSNIVLEVSLPHRLGMLTIREMAASVFNRLFLRQAGSPQYFHPVIIHAPWHQLWEVRGDAWRPR